MNTPALEMPSTLCRKKSWVSGSLHPVTRQRRRQAFLLWVLCALSFGVVLFSLTVR